MSSSAPRKRGEGKMKPDTKRRKKKEVVSPPVIQNRTFRRLEQSLLVGIPNDITLNQIATRLPWRFLPDLFSASSAWRQALEDGLVQDARVRLHTAETLVVVNHSHYVDAEDITLRTNAMSIYSVKDRTFDPLPSIPEIPSGIPWKCQCVSLAGKIFILGGSDDIAVDGGLGSKGVYMWDLCGPKEWKLCAPMLKGTQQFACGVLNGKIYVFGGRSQSRHVHGSEIYDPSRDTWSMIEPIGVQQFDHDVAAVGEEFYLYGGKWPESRPRSAQGVKAYHPRQNKWRVLIPSNRPAYQVDGRLFVAQGKVHSMTPHSIFTYEFDNKLWTTLHTFSFAAIQRRHTPAGARIRWPPTVTVAKAVVLVDNELLAIVSALKIIDGLGSSYCHWLVRSTGFNGGNQVILWQEVQSPPSFSLEAWTDVLHLASPILFPLQL